MKKIIEETTDHVIFEDIFDNKPIRFYLNKQTGDLRINSDDAFQALGFNGLDGFLGSNQGLDYISQSKEENPNFELFGKNGVFKDFDEL